jgi:hypothetical protein
MKLYEVKTTEYNGEQEYSFSHLLAAKNLSHAKEIARKYFKNWYQDDESGRPNKDDSDSFEFINGTIILKITGVVETTLEEWLDRQIDLHRVNKLPKDKIMSQKDKTLTTFMIKEQCPDTPFSEIKVNILSEGGKLWIQPTGFGEKSCSDGDGYPIGLEIWQGRLRLIVFEDINKEDPQIIDLEKAKESCRIKEEKDCKCESVNEVYCTAAQYLADEGHKVFTGSMIGGIWNTRCMDACILSKKEDDKAAYKYLVKQGDRIAKYSSANQKLQWQELKGKAAAILSNRKNVSNIEHPEHTK